MVIADPQVHEELFKAANAVESKSSTNNDVIIDKLSVTNASMAGFGNPSMLRTSVAFVKQEDLQSSEDDIPAVIEEVADDGDMCVPDDKEKYLAMQNKTLIEMVENLQDKLSKQTSAQDKVNY